MARLSALCICVCAVLLCSVFVSDVDSRFRGWSFLKFKPPSRTPPLLKTPVFHRKAPKPHTNNPPIGFQHFQTSVSKPQTNAAPIGFQHFQTSVSKPQTNAAPIGFQHFHSPAIKSQTPIGFESFSKNPRAPSAPALPVPQQNIPYTHNVPVVPGLRQNSPYTPSAPALPAFYQNIPNAPGTPSVSTGFYQPVGGIFPSNQYTGKVNNPYQSNPNYGWNVYGSSHFKPSTSYPQTGYPNNRHSNMGYPNTAYPNTFYQNPGFTYNPSQPFGQHSNPNFGHQIYPNNYLGNSYYGAQNRFSNPNFGNSYNPYGNNYFPGGGYGYSGYPGQFGYNDYKPKSKFGFGGLPIPIPIPIPLGGFGFGGLGGHRSNDNSHRVLNSLQNTTSLNSTTNATSIYVVNNVTVVSCTNELFTYGPINITVTTCTADNCTSVKVYMANNSSVNQSVVTMCLGPNVTVTSNSSDTVKLEVSNISTYWHMVCAVTPNSTVNNTATNSTTQNATEPIVTTAEANQNGTGNITVNVASNTNSTDRFCEIFNCSYVEMCLPETSIDSNTKKAYKPCVRIKMCKSPNTPISHHVTLNTTVIRYEEVDSIVNKTESYSLNNITVLAFYPVRNNCSANSTGNDTSCFLPTPPITNTTDIVQANNNSTVPTCIGSDGTPSVCDSATPGNVTSNNNSTSSISPELLKVLESEANKYNTSLGSLLQYLNHRSS